MSNIDNKPKKIKSCKYYALRIEVASPICVSSGVAEYTDSDVMRNGDGEVFIPGTTLAGAFRSYIENKKNEQSIFGYSKGEEGRMSSVFISDLYFDNDVRISERDHVKLNEEKQVNNKFDTEILETGAEGIIYFHYIEREEGNLAKVFDKEISEIAKGIQGGYIRIGSNKNRGFGRLKILEVKSKVFIEKERDALLEFKSKYYKNIDKYDLDEINEKLDEKIGDSTQLKYMTLRVPLKLTGGISIRKYSTKPEEADYEHIKCKGKPVIPGSSWNGAIRAMCTRILNELTKDRENVKNYIDVWFGPIVVGKKEKESKLSQSMIVFSESVIEGGKDKIISRNKINRFDGSTVDGALYTEKAHFGGTTNLEIMIRKDKEGYYKALAGLIELVVDDIKNGYVAVGGQAAIGRGIFEGVNIGETQYEWQGEDNRVDYNNALYEFIKTDL